MAVIVPFRGRTPRVAPDAFVAPNATLVGDVEVGAGATIWFGAVLRADFGSIRVGPRTSVQDNVVIHSDPDTLTDVGSDVTIGHAAVLEACRVGDGSVVGVNATLLPGSVVGAGAMVAAGAVVREGFEVADGRLAAGVPAVDRGPLPEGAKMWVSRSAPAYVELGQEYLRAQAQEAGE